MRSLRTVAAGALAAAFLFGASPAAHARNVVIFVADGLRSHAVTPETAPALAALRAEGVDFANSHSLYPTITTPNASAIATGHRLGDTGDFGNSIWVGGPLGGSYGQIVQLEDDAAQALLNRRFGGDYLGEVTLLEAARAKGFSTAVLGKHARMRFRHFRASTIFKRTTGVDPGREWPGPVRPSWRRCGGAASRRENYQACAVPQCGQPTEVVTGALKT